MGNQASETSQPVVRPFRRDSAGLYSKIDVLRDKQWIDVRIVGHADTVGGEQSNLELSRHRAAAVLRFLADSVSRARLDTESYGESMPLKSEGGNADDRRVEFLVIDRSTPQPVIVWNAVLELDTIAVESEELEDNAPGCIVLTDVGRPADG